MADYPPAPSYGVHFTSNTAPQTAPQPSFSSHDGAHQAYATYSATTPHHASDAFRYNATLPGVDLQALGVNAAQIHSFMAQIQSGALPPPPFPPPPLVHQNGFPPPPPPFSAAASPYQPIQSFPFPQPYSSVQMGQKNSQLRAGQNSRIEGIVNIEREEGELSDKDTASSPRASKRAKVTEIPRSNTSSHQHRWRVSNRSDAYDPFHPTYSASMKSLCSHSPDRADIA